MTTTETAKRGSKCDKKSGNKLHHDGNQRRNYPPQKIGNHSDILSQAVQHISAMPSEATVRSHPHQPD